VDTSLNDYCEVLDTVAMLQMDKLAESIERTMVFHLKQVIAIPPRQNPFLDLK
jgi:hypothetical protein